MHLFGLNHRREMTKGTLSFGSKTVVPRPPTFRSRPMTIVATPPGRRGNVTGVAKATDGTHRGQVSEVPTKSILKIQAWILGEHLTPASRWGSIQFILGISTISHAINALV